MYSKNGFISGLGGGGWREKSLHFHYPIKLAWYLGPARGGG